MVVSFESLGLLDRPEMKVIQPTSAGRVQKPGGVRVFGGECSLSSFRQGLSFLGSFASVG
jgi:hypothetical protein